MVERVVAGQVKYGSNWTLQAAWLEKARQRQPDLFARWQLTTTIRGRTVGAG